MGRYIFRRLLNLIPVLLGISLIDFGVMSFVSGDPAEIMLSASGIQPTVEAVTAVRHALGLDEPLYLQYCHWLWNVLHLNLGISFRSSLPVAAELMQRLPATLELTLCALCITLLIGVPLGILAALHRDTLIDHACSMLSLAGASMPAFWLALLLIYYLSVRLRLFPSMGMGGIGHLLLPAFTLGFGLSSAYIRLLRASILETMQKQFIVAAQAKGMTARAIMLRHVLKNAMLPVVTLLGMNFGHLLGGSAIVETVFSWPGIGKFMVDAIYSKDYPVIQGYVLMVAVFFVLANLLVDLFYALLDPRIKLR